MSDLFAHAAARDAAHETSARRAADLAAWQAHHDSPAERRRRRAFALSFAVSLREEARDGERRGWPDYAAKWHADADRQLAIAEAEAAALVAMGEAVE